MIEDEIDSSSDNQFKRFKFSINIIVIKIE